MRNVLLIAMILLLAPALLHAEVFSYTDKAGTVHFVEDLNSIPKQYRKKVKVSSDQPTGNVVDTANGTYLSVGPKKGLPESLKKKPAAQVTAKKVELYVTSTCPYCRQAESYLSQKGIPYTAYDVNRDQAAASRFRSLGGRGVPLIVIGTKTISGFSAEAIDMALASQ